MTAVDIVIYVPLNISHEFDDTKLVMLGWYTWCFSKKFLMSYTDGKTCCIPDKYFPVSAVSKTLSHSKFLLLKVRKNIKKILFPVLCFDKNDALLLLVLHYDLEILVGSPTRSLSSKESPINF